MKPSHDVKKFRTRSYRFSGYNLKRDRNNNIYDALPPTPTTPYGNLTDRATATPSTPPRPVIKAGNISNDQQAKK
jgi:hypothetical protein